MRTVVLYYSNVPDDITAEDLAADVELWLATGVTVSPYPPRESVGGR